jgi:hypothetical protein
MHLRAFQRPEGSGAEGNVQWVQAAIVIVSGLVAIDAAVSFFDYIATKEDQERDPRICTSSDEQAMDKMQADDWGKESRGLSLVEKRAQEIILVRSVADVETKRSLVFMAATVALFQFALGTFYRTPEMPLQP